VLPTLSTEMSARFNYLHTVVKKNPTNGFNVILRYVHVF